jgi:cyclic pyranopterin phosphate synthase
LLDLLNRPLRNLRLSVTDRCNIRCEYCMPEDDYVWLPREDMLHFEEISALVDLFIELGVDKVRLTGGEPLLRRDLPILVRLLATKPGLRDLALTTNGVLLGDQIDVLRAAGLGRVTVSLDTLRPDRFARLTRFDYLDRVRAGIEAARRAFGSDRTGPEPLSSQTPPARLKIDTVVIRGVNDDELTELVDYAKSMGAELRFIEYMDVGGATRWSPDRVVSRAEMLAALGSHYGAIEPIAEVSSAPAERFALPDGTTFGIIASTTEPFCRRCDRSRLTADGLWYLCLYGTQGLDLRGPLRRHVRPEELKALIRGGWQRRTDKGAEDRLRLGDRRAFVPINALRRDPHLEMHTRGG